MQKTNTFSRCIDCVYVSNKWIAMVAIIAVWKTKMYWTSEKWCTPYPVGGFNLYETF